MTEEELAKEVKRLKQDVANIYQCMEMIQLILRDIQGVDTGIIERQQDIQLMVKELRTIGNS